MIPTPSEIALAAVMVALTVAMFVWLRGNLAAATAGRMAAMMARVGLDPRATPVESEMRRRCARCAREDLCDRWLAGKVAGVNDFCPNAEAFGSLR